MHIPSTMALPTATPTPINIWDTMSFGNCTSTQEYPSLHCLPALWFWWFTAMFFVCLGLSLLAVLKILRCVIRRNGYKDVYHNAFEPTRASQGGMIGLGTSSIAGRERERWVDIEQRAALYSPDPEAAVARANSIRTQRGVVTHKEIKFAEEELLVAGEEDYFTLARPPSWFRERKGRDAKDTERSLTSENAFHSESSRGRPAFVPVNDVLSDVPVDVGKESWRRKTLP